ncbi:NAD(P)H-quinone oxidoreductase subunit 2, chloroplastic [bioreactor metagenome]|uniref:NAD(P)H-quinone oxidoreductase subunit 2, chloroplastic n=1 Tax=bioreactor metagenome TaxID=1076179 RepID=A0A644VLF1_9ZZZZ|nr:proton-conducting transporter membrane subunit [Acidaminococcaceae bacterium]
MQQMFYIILGLPPFFAAIAITRCLSNNLLHWLNRLTALIVTGAFVYMTMLLPPNSIFNDGIFYLDALSMWFLFIVVTLYFMSSLLSKGYLDKEATRGYLKRKNTFIGKYYALFTMFVWTMFLVLVTKNLGLMWVCIEATTLVSALLVSFKHTRGALEAAWKYIMVCTVGICLALLGTIILYYAQLTVLGAVKPLDWLWLKQNAVLLNPNLLRMSFLFIIIGYGTKIGLAPMHTWLPDAYSQAPSLISGLLSGALCACAIYVLMRNLVIIVPAVGIGFILNILYVFAFLTVAIAVPFAIVQRDIKRLLAYSSMENIGIMIIGLAIFTNNSVSAVLLHLFNHAMIKFALFFLAGTIIQEYQTSNMMRIHGMMNETPYTATFTLLGMFAILGMPPFGIFFSKFTIIMEIFKSGQYLLGSLFVLLLAGVLMGVVYHFLRMLSCTPKRRALGELLNFNSMAILLVMLVSTIAISTCLENFPYLQVLLSSATQIVVGGTVL